MLLSRNLVYTFLASSFVAGIVIACGSDSESKFGENDPILGDFTDAGFETDGNGIPGDDLYKNDPPSSYACAPTGQPTPPPVTGTESCPDDKNKPGCACQNVGEEKPCWTGLRKNRNLGVCKDGVAKCLKQSELLNVWGQCEGQTLPTPGATGAEACGCFSEGTWTIRNTSPCLYYGDQGNASTYRAWSTIGDDGSGCTNPMAPNTQNWSTSTLKVDCEGTFTLCFRIRAGNFKEPKESDCVLGTVCVNDVLYPTKNQVLELPPLPAWRGTDSACAYKWETTDPNTSPGYGEMLVKGETYACDEVGGPNNSERVFNRVEYCPLICRDPANKDLEPCRTCQLSGQGTF